MKLYCCPKCDDFFKCEDCYNANPRHECGKTPFASDINLDAPQEGGATVDVPTPLSSARKLIEEVEFDSDEEKMDEIIHTSEYGTNTTHDYASSNSTNSTQPVCKNRRPHQWNGWKYNTEQSSKRKLSLRERVSRAKEHRERESIANHEEVETSATASSAFDILESMGNVEVLDLSLWSDEAKLEAYQKIEENLERQEADERQKIKKIENEIQRRKIAREEQKAQYVQKDHSAKKKSSKKEAHQMGENKLEVGRIDADFGFLDSFDVIDVNGDGVIDREEWKNAATAAQQQQQHIGRPMQQQVEKASEEKPHEQQLRSEKRKLKDMTDAPFARSGRWDRAEQPKEYWSRDLHQVLPATHGGSFHSSQPSGSRKFVTMPNVQTRNGGTPYKLHESVEVYSKSKGRWFEGVVIAILPEGRILVRYLCNETYFEKKLPVTTKDVRQTTPSPARPSQIFEL